MKRLFDNYVAVAAILCLAAVSCEKTGDGTFQDAELTVSPEVIEYNPSRPESNVFTVESNVGWKISTSEDKHITLYDRDGCGFRRGGNYGGACHCRC